jgi:lipopolysaccharide export system permease protein
MTAAGATIWRIAKPLILLAFLVSLAVSAVNHWAMPWSLRLLRDYVIQVRTDLITQVIQPGRFSSPEQNLTFHIRDREPDGDLLGLILHDARDEKKITSYLAERGQIIKQGSASYLLMVKGHIIQRTKLDGPSDIVAFQRYAVDLDRFEQKDDTVELKPRERYYDELVAPPDPKAANYKSLVGAYRAELHERFASPLYPLAFVLIAVAIIGQAKTTRQNRVRSIVTAFTLAAICRLGGLAATNLVSLRASALWILYGIPIVAIILALIGAQLGMQPRRSSRLGAPADWLEAAWEHVRRWAALPWRRMQPTERR